ncbi:protein kinase domain-containing protein [Babesia caballi]|uniref:Protein kinase domain-containing protein n=1 Tax=Babesia caballi TaxID=5871 RepID=A0AAV4LWL3_BABCB|nr:protein kinase domain-containing protein [Babesia caballi]
MRDYMLDLVKRVGSANVRVVTKCVYWKPIRINHDFDKSHLQLEESSKDHIGDSDTITWSKNVIVGRAVNQYFYQSRIAQTNTATLWLCFDVVANNFCCIKSYCVRSCRRERAIRYCGTDMEVITLLDKVIDEVLYHSSVTSHPGVSTIREIIVNTESDVLYLVMDYYPMQLLYFDSSIKAYTAPWDGDGNVVGADRVSQTLHLYKEDDARIIMKDIVSTVSSLHSVGIFHKDLKPENILLTGKVPYAYEAVPLPSNAVENEVAENMVSNDFDLCNDVPSEDVIQCVKQFIDTGVGPSYYDVELSQVAANHFPYQNTMEFNPEWAWGDTSQIVCDIIQEGTEGTQTMRIGKAAANFAKNVAQLCNESSKSVGEFFLLKHNQALPYTQHGSFLAAVEQCETGVELSRQHSRVSVTISETLPSGTVITDFGVSSVGELQNDRGELLIFDGEGTPSFSSPESLQYVDGGISGEKRDVFSLGVVLYAMMYGTLPYEGNGSIELLINMSLHNEPEGRVSEHASHISCA